MNQVNEKIIEILEKIKKKIKNLCDKLSKLDKESLKSQLNQIIEYINEQENIANVISTLEKELDQTKKNYELNLIFSVIPIDSIEEKFTINNEMKKFLEQNIPTDSQGRPIFDRELMEVNEYFVHQCNRKYEGGSIIINIRGFLIYGLHFNPYNKELFNESSELVYHLQLYEITDYFLGFLKFINKFFHKVDYNGDIQISIKIEGLSKWQYLHGEPEKPLKCMREISGVVTGRFNVKNILENEKSILIDIIGPILNCYNQPREKITIYYQKIRKV